MIVKGTAATILLFIVGLSQGLGQSALQSVERSLSGMGVVHFIEGDSARGDISYINSFKIEVNGKPHSPKSVDSFYFYDSGKSKKRFFLALEYDDKRLGQNTFFFFELLFEFESFALLKKIDPEEIFKTTGPINGRSFASTSQPMSATYEQIYVFDQAGNTEPYLESRYLKQEVVTRVVSDKLLFSLLGPHLAELKKFAKTNKLSFEDKNDFLKIMEYYAKLSKASRIHS